MAICVCVCWSGREGFTWALTFVPGRLLSSSSFCRACSSGEQQCDPALLTVECVLPTLDDSGHPLVWCGLGSGELCVSGSLGATTIFFLVRLEGACCGGLLLHAGRLPVTKVAISSVGEEQI